MITGPPGSGKTPLIRELARLGYGAVDEPARIVIAEQRAIFEKPVYDRDLRLFLKLMLARAIAERARFVLETLDVADRSDPGTVR